MKIYCESGALTENIKKLGRSGRVDLVHFPYDPNSHTGKITNVAVPSGAQIRDLNLTIAELPGLVSDYSGSAHLDEIRSIIGRTHRRDALHIDSAFIAGCSAFVTQDTDILNHKARLEKLLGIRFFSDSDFHSLEQFVADDSE
jgi:hypothetical protein